MKNKFLKSQNLNGFFCEAKNFKISHTNQFFSFFSIVLVLSPSKLAFTKTQRGRSMLVYDGFKYVVNRESQKNIFWRCNRYVKFGCRAGAVTSKNEDQTIRLTHIHSHSRDKTSSTDIEAIKHGEEIYEIQEYS